MNYNPFASMFFIALTKHNQQRIKEILILNNIKLGKQTITDELWNKLLPKMEYITFHENGKFLSWHGTYVRPIKLYCYTEISVESLDSVLKTGQLEF